MNKQKIRITITIVLLFIIAITSVYLYQNRDKLFTSRYEITYPDHCIEVFENDKLISDECTLGRQVYEESLNKTNKPPIGMTQWNLNLT